MELDFHVNLVNLTNFKTAGTTLNIFLMEYLKPLEADTTVKLWGYFKPFELKKLLLPPVRDAAPLKNTKCV